MKKRIILAFLGLILLTLSAVFFFGPSYAKKYIEEHDNELIGRKITIENIDFNIFNGHFTVSQFKMYELDTHKVFVQFDTLFTDLTIYKVFKGEFLTEALYLKNPQVSVSITDDSFNFADLLPKQDSITKEPDTTQAFIKRFTINDIQILNGTANYENHDNSASHHLNGMNFKVPGISFGNKHTSAGIEFALAEGGAFNINIDYQLSNNAYLCEMKVEKLDLHPYLIYLQPYLKITDFQGQLSGDLTIIGDLDEPETPEINGIIQVDSIRMIDEENTEVFRLSSLFLSIDKLNMEKKQFLFKKLHITKPYIHGIIYTDYDNLDNLIKEQESDTIPKPGLNKVPVTYLIEEFRLNNGTFFIENKALSTGKFNYTLSNINLKTNHLTEGVMVKFMVDALLNGKGKMKGQATLDPENPGAKATFDLDIRSLPIKDFSPYSLQSTAYPVYGGRLTFQTINKVQDNWLTSHLVMKIYKTDIGEKNKNIKPEYNVPLKFGVAVMEDPHELINIDVTAEGDLTDPEFKYTKLIWKAVMNVLVKAAASPYNLLAGSVGAKEEDIKFIKYGVMQVKLGPEQTTQLDYISKLLTRKPQLTATGSFTMDEEKERKLLKYYIAKRGFYLDTEYKSDTANVELKFVDKVKINNMEETPKLIRFLEKKTRSEKGVLSFKQLVDKYVSVQKLDATFIEMMQLRKAFLENYFAKNGMSNQFKILDTWVNDKKVNKPQLLIEYKVAE